MPKEPPGFDEVQTQVQAPPAKYATRALRHRVEVQWTDARGAQSVELDGRLVVGSAAGSGILVEDPAVSRIHAELELREDGLWIRDLGSRNGTFIEGILVTLGRVPDGGAVRVGSTLLAVRREATPKPVELWPLDAFGQLLGTSADARAVRAAREGRAHRHRRCSSRARPARARSSCAARSTQAQRARRRAVRRRRLRRHPRDPARVRALRTRQRSFTGAVAPRQGALRGGRRRHGLPRRGRRDAAGAAAQAAARLEAREIRRVGEQRARARSTCASCRRPTATCARGQRGHVPRGPVLPPRRHSDPGSCPAGAPRGPGPADAELRPRGHGSRARAPRRGCEAGVAGQRPRAAQLRRTRGCPGVARGAVDARGRSLLIRSRQRRRGPAVEDSAERSGPSAPGDADESGST